MGLRDFDWVDKDSSYLIANVRLYSIDLVKEPIHPEWRIIEKLPEDFMYGPLWSRTHRPSPVDTGKFHGPERNI